MKKSSASITAGAPVTLARLDSGDPFLVERKFGEGRVIACATALDADWSNLPMRPSYLPWLQRLTVYLASTIFPPRNLDVGNAIAAFTSAADVDKEATLTKPTGEIEKAKVVKRGTRGLVGFTRTQAPGLVLCQ